VGIWLTGCDSRNNHILGNFVGLDADGRLAVGCTWGIYLDGGHDNVIGGRLPGATNVIAGNYQGVSFGGDAKRNRVEGNCLGMDSSGTTQITQTFDLVLYPKTAAQILGGDQPEAGNFCAGQTGLRGDDLKPGTVVRYNTFGKGPTGADFGIGVGAVCVNCSPRIADNTFANAQTGLYVRRPGARPTVVRNTFRCCQAAVRILGDAQPNLGDLSNGSPNDDGGNVFSPSNAMHILNRSAKDISAQNNDFGTTVVAEIAARIIDHEDNPAYGVVSFLPLLGGAGRTATAAGPPALVSAACQPTRTEAVEISIVLAAEAEVWVDVVNVAGRHVRWIVQETPVRVGLNRLAWNRRSDSGLVAPAGRYVVRVVTRQPDGSRAQLLAPVMLRP